jgi:hypothetical protein
MIKKKCKHRSDVLRRNYVVGTGERYNSVCPICAQPKHVWGSTDPYIDASLSEKEVVIERKYVKAIDAIVEVKVIKRK